MTIPCTVNECTTPVKALGLCQKHYMRRRRTGDATMVRNTNGPANGRWKGDAAKYTAVHHRLYRLRGPAARHPCEHCAGDAEDWAYDRTDPNQLIDLETGFPYSTDPARYLVLCKVCHYRFDRQELNGVITA